jgi:REP element-mobilizing transposase RayT
LVITKKESTKVVNPFVNNKLVVYGDKSVLWNNSYFIASCGGVTVERLKEYVQSQDAPHG